MYTFKYTCICACIYGWMDIGIHTHPYKERSLKSQVFLRTRVDFFLS